MMLLLYDFTSMRLWKMCYAQNQTEIIIFAGIGVFHAPATFWRKDD
jgi:hypothetical protein